MKKRTKIEGAENLRIKETIYENGYNIESYSERLNITRQALSNFINGWEPVPVKKLEIMCQDFKVRKEYLLGIDSYRNDDEMLEESRTKDRIYIMNRIMYYKDFGIDILIIPKENIVFQIYHEEKLIKECNINELLKIMRQLDSFTQCAINSLLLDK